MSSTDQLLAGRVAENGPTFLLIACGEGACAPLEQIVKALRPIRDVVCVMALNRELENKDELISGVRALAPNRVQVIDAQTGNIEVEPSSIYILVDPEAHTFCQGVFMPVTRAVGSTPVVAFPIDSIFEVIAGEKQHDCIAVQLSGGNEDGACGALSVNEYDGVVFAQDPNEASCKVMPAAAIAATRTELVFPAEELAKRLFQYLSHPYIRACDSLKLNEDKQVLADIVNLVFEKSGINFQDYKQSTIARRIERRVGINFKSTLRDYYALLVESPSELNTLIKELLISVTHFFRDPQSFDVLEQELISKVRRDGDSKHALRVWCAGCATGEEAYSIAMLIDDVLSNANLNRPVKIFCTDVGKEVLDVASQGQYPVNIESHVPKKYLDRYFNKVSDHYIIDESIRRSTIFAKHDMMVDPPFSGVDLIVCRNVLIYFQAEVQKRIISNFQFGLNPNGLLFLGSSESIGDLSGYFKVIHDRAKIFEKVGNMRVPYVSSRATRQPSVHTPAGSFLPVTSLAHSHKDLVKNSPQNYFKERLNQLYIPPCIVINEEHEAVHVYGDLGLIVKPPPTGAVSTDIKNMVSDGLRTAVSTALSKAQKERDTVRYTNVQLKKPDKDYLVNITVHCLDDKNAHNSMSTFYAVIFEVVGEENSANQVSQSEFDMIEQSQKRIFDLEEELLKSQEHLQITIEELETTNEELQSANEELMSSNEELQSTNEELQSVNEELHTVNTENEQKIVELKELNDDTNNIIASTDIGIFFLDDKLLIRKYTSSVNNHFHVLSTDIGRPFIHFSHEIVSEDVANEITNVLSSGSVVEKTVSTHKGAILLMRISPYINNREPNIKSGVVISFTDISKATLVESALRGAYQTIRERANGAPENTGLADTEDALSILIVDDVESDRKLVTSMLARLGNPNIRITEATDSDSVMALFNQGQKFDLCLLDFKLAKETAASLINNCKPLQDIPVIILSGYLTKERHHGLPNMEHSLIVDFIEKDELNPEVIKQSLYRCMSAKRTYEN